MRTRRKLLLCALGFMVSAVALPPAQSAGNEPPNILVIVTDDQRRDTMSMMPATHGLFRQQGVYFKNGVTTTPNCCPSRASIFTGRYAHNHGVKANDQPLADHDSTMQRYLQDAGYSTALAGKFLNSWVLEEEPPHFDRWALTKFGYHEFDVNADGNVYRETTSYHSDYLADKASEFLEDFESSDEEPWFIYLAPNAPHRPPQPEEEYSDYPVPPWRSNPAVTEADLSDKPPWVEEESMPVSTSRLIRRRQLRTLVSVDEMVADVFSEMERLEETNTIAVYMSDNGYLWSEHDLGHKGQPYSPAIRIPFYMRWPGHLEPSRSDALAANIDIAPTLLDAAGIDVQMDGESLLQPLDRKRLLLEHWTWVPDWASLRNERKEYVEYYDEKGEIIFRELYDLEKDPWQLRNILLDGSQTNDPSDGFLARLSQRLDRARRCSGAGCP